MTEAQRNELISYTDGDLAATFTFDGQTLWLTQEQIASLFNTTKQNVSKHIKKIFDDEELDPQVTVNEKLILVENGRRYPVQHYNLDVVIAVGYRVNSKVATKFRQWATKILSERITGTGVDHRLAHDSQRAMIFKRVSLANDELLQTAIKMGVVALPAFFDVGYQGLYTMRTAEIKKRKGIGTDKVLDRAGPVELAMNEFRITQTQAKIGKLLAEGKLVGQGVAFTTHYEVSREIRNAVQRIDGELPEDISAEPEHINEVQQRLGSESQNGRIGQ